MAKDLTTEQQHAERIRASLKQLGIADIDLDGIKALWGKPKPYTLRRWMMMDENKIKLQISFDKSFGIDHYVMSFVPKLPVNHATINGVDTKSLEETIRSADWYYASESSSLLEKQYHTIEKVEADIHRLVTSPEGLRLATILWNNYVPFYAATKPELIRAYEDSSDLYMAKKFKKDVSIEQAYSELRDAVSLNATAALSPDAVVSTSNTSSIIIADDHLVAIKELLQKQRREGNEWIAFDEGRPILEKDDLNFFETHFDVSEFCHDNTTDRDFYDWMSIREFEIGVEKWKKIRNSPEEFTQFVESKMKHADWNYKGTDNYNRFFDGEKEIGQVNYLLSLVKKEAGIERANALWNQYASATSILKPDFLTDKNKVMMTGQELTQNKREFGLIGVSAAFTEELINRMKTGTAKIEHPYATKNPVTGDEANTTFYLSKSKESNLYFLNKWDVSVKQFGTENTVQKTFYNNDLKRIGHLLKNADQLVTTFTHARCINYLSGRPVLNTHKNQNGRIEKVWDQAFPKEKQINGKIKERSFHKEYGFDLQKISEEYRRGIKSLSNPEHVERFYQSLERGNLEKATFVEKDGKENPYYVSANIRVGFLDVYSECSGKAKPLTPEQLAEKGFISQEFAVKVRERMNQMEKQTQRQAVGAEGKPVVNNVKSDNATVPGQKQAETVGKGEGAMVNKQAAETVGKQPAETAQKQPSENVTKKNNQRQKGDDGGEKPKKKMKPKVS